MHRRVARISLFVVALLIGLLLVGQLRSQARPIELRNLSAQELSTLIEALSARNAELRAGLANLRDEVRTYEQAQSGGQSTLEVTAEELRRIRGFGALAAVAGQGIVVDVDGALDATAVNDLINELRNAGAEAIAIDEVRITARSVTVMGSGFLQVDDQRIGSPFAIRAIGSPDGLFSALERPGGITTQLEQSVAATITIQESESLRLPATTIDLTPEVAQPAE